MKQKKVRIPWSETPEGREHAEFAERAKQGRPQVNENLCFVCQEKRPTCLTIRGNEEFKVCDTCGSLIESQNRTRNGIKQALSNGQGGNIFRMVLGVDLLPTKITVKPLPRSEEDESK